VRTALRGILANLTCFALLVGAQAVAQQQSSENQQQPVVQPRPEVISLGSPQPSPLLPSGEVEIEQGRGLEAAAGGPFGQPAVSPCCEICGGGSCCPADWYLDEGVRILSRNHSRGIVVTQEFASSTSPATPLISVPGWVQVRLDNSSTAEDESLWDWNTYRTLSDVMSLRSLGFSGQTGYYATLGHYLGRDTDNRDHFFEFTYWGLNTWEDSLTVTGVLQPSYFTARNVSGILNKGSRVQNPDGTISTLQSPPISDYSGSLRTPFPLETELPFATDRERAISESFNNVLEHTIWYRSKMDDFELNVRLRPRGRPDRLVMRPNGTWRRECQPGDYFSYLFGIRLMSIDEAFSLRSRGTTTVPVYGNFIPDPAPPPDYVPGDGTYVIDHYEDYDVSGQYLARTCNDLFGLQVGADWIFRRCKWEWGVRVKLGPYVNFADQRSEITTAENPLYPAERIFRASKKDCISLVGEVGLVATYKIRPNLIVTGAYDFMWIANVALAPEQLVFSGLSEGLPDEVNTGGDIYSHGLTLSAKLLW